MRDLPKVGTKRTDRLFVFQLDKIVHAITADEHGIRPQHGGKALWCCGRGNGLRREIELDPGSAVDQQPIRSQKSAARLKARLLIDIKCLALPQVMGAGQRSVTAEVPLAAWGEPSEIVTVLTASAELHEKRRLRVIHFDGDPLH